MKKVDIKKAIKKDGYYQVPDVDFELGIEPNNMQGDYEVFCWPHGVVRLADNLDAAIEQLEKYIKERF